MEKKRTLALVGVVGGAGTTRLAVEMAVTLARAGHDAAVIDAAFETQGLSQYAEGRLDPDVTQCVADDAPLAEALVDLPVDAPGRAVACPAYAPFERVARAKTAGAAERFERLVEQSAEQFDAVLVDTPPVAANQSVAAVSAAERVALVSPGTHRGVDALQRARGRLADVGVDSDAVVATRCSGAHPVESAAASVPESSVTAVADAPACDADVDAAFAPAVADATETLLDVSLDLEFPDDGWLDGRLPS